MRRVSSRRRAVPSVTVDGVESKPETSRRAAFFDSPPTTDHPKRARKGLRAGGLARSKSEGTKTPGETRENGWVKELKGKGLVDDAFLGLSWDGREECTCHLSAFGDLL